jgi:hypothetical protein
VILAELWSCGPVAARSPYDGVEVLGVLVPGTAISARTRRAAHLQHGSHRHPATAYHRNRVSIFAAINQASASRNLCQNHLPCKFTCRAHRVFAGRAGRMRDGLSAAN